MEQSPSGEANISSFSQKNSQRFMELECSLPHSQAPASYPSPETEHSSPCLTILIVEDPF